MREKPIKDPVFYSILASSFEDFIREKRACGCKYSSNRLWYLKDFDNFLISEMWGKRELNREVVDKWTERRPHESPGTNGVRRSILRQFALFLFRIGTPTYIPSYNTGPISRLSYTPKIFTKEEIRRILNVVDELPVTAYSPLRHLAMPEVFRLLYCCGLRIGEALRLKVKDADLKTGVLTIRNSKFGKDRFVPMAPSMTNRLTKYLDGAGINNSESFLFPSRDGGQYHIQPIYLTFRKALFKVGISHGGRNHGPRIHDFRHTFAVHRLAQWHREGADISAKLPVLAAYLGHCGINGTQRYLHLTPEIFQDLSNDFERRYGYIIKGGPSDETD